MIPLYWQLLNQFNAVELICHRVVWSFVTLTIVLLVKRSWDNRPNTSDHFLWLINIPVGQHGRIIRWSVVASLLIACNWLVFVWSVQSNLIIECSLGYFVTPLMSVALGVIVFGERLRRVHWIAIGLAASGVSYLTWLYGSIPIFALFLALSFALYGIVKKRASLAAIPGLWLETMMLLGPALGFLIYRHVFSTDLQSPTAFGQKGILWDLLIASTGPVTTVPLLLFAYGAQRIPLSRMGLLQYIAPSMQFWVGWFVMRETVSPERWFGFSLVWLGLSIFVASTIAGYRPKMDLE